MRDQGSLPSKPDPDNSARGSSSVANSGEQDNRSGEAFLAGLGNTDGGTVYPDPSLPTSLFLEHGKNKTPNRRRSFSNSGLSHPADAPDPESMEFFKEAWPSADGFNVTPQPYRHTPVPGDSDGGEIRNPGSPHGSIKTEVGTVDIDRTSPVKGPLSHAHMSYLSRSRSTVRGPHLSVATTYAPEHTGSDVHDRASHKPSPPVDQVSGHSGGSAARFRDSDATITVDGSDPHGYKEAGDLFSIPEHAHVDIASSPPLSVLSDLWASEPEPSGSKDKPMKRHGYRKHTQQIDDCHARGPTKEIMGSALENASSRYERSSKRPPSPDSPCPPGRTRPRKVSRRGVNDAK